MDPESDLVAVAHCLEDDIEAGFGMYHPRSAADVLNLAYFPDLANQALTSDVATLETDIPLRKDSRICSE